MTWLWRKHRKTLNQERVSQTEAIKNEIKRKAAIVAKETEEINKLLEDNPGGIAALIVYATGNFHRRKK